MNLYNAFLKFIIILLFSISISSSLHIDKTTSINNLKTTNLLNNDETNENTIDYVQPNIDNKTSIEQHQILNHTDNLINSIKKNIDSKLIDENSLDLKSIKLCNETTEFRCKANNECISKTMVCDGFKDCPNNEDEMNCDQNCSLYNKFQCKSDGKCIDMISKCNSIPDCADGSDEDDCFNLISECTKDEFECSSGGCIHKNKFCDRTRDCDDGSDELFCKYTCAQNEFQCRNDTTCIPEIMKCNSIADCADGSDEEGCIQNDQHLYTCAENEFSCQTEPKKCIPIENVCNDIDDCGNNHDEPPECNIDLCKDHKCSHGCLQTRNTIKCTCEPGFKLSENGTNCIDLNECIEIPGYCSGYECINTIGSATCNCPFGYRFNENENRCKVINGKNATIIYSNQNELRNTSLSIKSYLPSLLSNEKIDNFEIIRQNLNSISLFVYDYEDNYLIWYDMSERRFYISSLDLNRRPIERNEFWTQFKLPTPHHRSPRTLLNKNQHYILLENITNVEGMTLDYQNDLLYFTDTDRNVIEILNVREPIKRKILVETDLDEPKGIIIDVRRSFLLFTDWGQKPKIEFIRTDGTGRRTIYDKNLEWPYSITFNGLDDKIYWVDTKKNTLNVVDLDGNNHKILLTNSMYLERVNDLDIFEDRIFLCDQESESIISVDKFKPESTLNVLIKDLKNVLGCKIVHYSKQRKFTEIDKCLKSNCEFLCIPRNDLNSYKCACPNGMELNGDEHSCKESNNKNKFTKAVTKEIYNRNFISDLFISDTYKSNTNVIYIFALAVFLIIIVTVICSYLFINYARKRTNKLKFNNAQYQKTPQQDQTLPCCLEPLNQTATNEYV